MENNMPWKVDGNKIIQTFFNESWNKQVSASKEDVVIGKFNSCDQAEQAVRAVNGFEALQAENLRLRNAHDELLKVAKTFHGYDDLLHREAMPNCPYCETIAKAEGSSSTHGGK